MEDRHRARHEAGALRAPKPSPGSRSPQTSMGSPPGKPSEYQPLGFSRRLHYVSVMDGSLATGKGRHCHPFSRPPGVRGPDGRFPPTSHKVASLGKLSFGYSGAFQESPH